MENDPVASCWPLTVVWGTQFTIPKNQGVSDLLKCVLMYSKAPGPVVSFGFVSTLYKIQYIVYDILRYIVYNTSLLHLLISYYKLILLPCNRGNLAVICCLGMVLEMV